MACATSAGAAVEVCVGWVDDAVGSVPLDGLAGLVGDGLSGLDEEPGALDEERVDDGVPAVDDPVAPVVGDAVPAGPVVEVPPGVGWVPADGGIHAGSCCTMARIWRSKSVSRCCSSLSGTSWMEAPKAEISFQSAARSAVL